MDPDVDEYLIHSNTTNSSLESKLDFTTDVIFHLTFFCYALAIFSNAVLIYLVVRSKKLQNRRNLVITHWCIAHIICLVSIFLEHMIPYYSYKLRTAIFAVDVTQIFIKVFLMITLITHTIMKSNVPINLIAMILYGLAVVFVLLDVILDATVMRVFFGLFLLLGLAYGFIAVIVKHINKFRRRKTRPMSNESTLRLYLASLYIFTWVLYLMYFGIELHFAVMLILTPFFHLTPMFIIIILIMKDIHFKICFMQMFRCQALDADAAVCFVDECSDDEGDVNSHV